ncbi:MAG: ribonuclease III [candidate division WOR-3 bacterium]
MRLRQSQRLVEFEKKVGVKFKKKGLLKLALTHSSLAHRAGGKSNENLEFLGDAVLELAVREYLYKKYPQKDEGELNQLKKKYTSEESLYRIGKRIKIGDFLFMDHGEELTGGRKRPSNISSAIEALIGAIFLDRGWKYTRRFINHLILQRRLIMPEDYKSILNQWAMSEKKIIGYKIIEEKGLPHSKIFQIGLWVDNKLVATGMGTTKKKAEQEAARVFLTQMGVL